MKRATVIAALAAAAVWAGACTSATPEQQIVNDAADALGGAGRIQAVKTLVLEGEGTNGNLGQDMSPDATGQLFTVTAYKRAVDVGSGRSRTDQTRTPNFTYFQGQQPQRQVTGLDGDVAYNVGANGMATRAADAVAKDRIAETYHHPVTIVRAALDPAAKLSNPRTQDNFRVVDIATGNGLNFTLAIDATTKLPAKVVSMTDNTNLGDVAIETTFSDYQDVNGLKLPARFVTKTDKYQTADMRITKQSVDADTGDLAAPAAAASAPAPTPPPPNVTVEQVAPGIWWLAGQSHHSVLVEFADHMTLIETPQNDARALAVIAKAREIKPDKPLTNVIVTHHHFDHSGGIRAAVSEGLTLVTQRANAQYFQDAAQRPHTIVPDALSKNPKPAKVEAVDQDMELKDATRTVNLYRIAGSPHATTLLMAYFPKERILVEADVFSPGNAVAPFAPNLVDNINQRRLRVDRIVPIHGTIAPYADLVKTAEAQKTAAN
jgi:glyoxylase-like metal-dependent hydrolase (beta-lactamase superfamily II)